MKKEQEIKKEKKLKKEEKLKNILTEDETIEEKKEPVKDNIEKIEEDFEFKYLKSLAEMQNLRKRFEKDRMDFFKYKSSSLIQEIIPTIDMFEAALNSRDVSKEIKNWLIGFEMVLKNLKITLESEGVKEISVKLGDDFDSRKHQSIDVKETNRFKEGTIVQIKLKGYKLYDRLLRPASVVLAKNKSLKNKGENNE